VLKQVYLLKFVYIFGNHVRVQNNQNGLIKFTQMSSNSLFREQCLEFVLKEKTKNGHFDQLNSF